MSMKKEFRLECALYQGELWTVNSLLDKKTKYKEDLRLKMRKESQNNAFTCPDCGKYLVLCAGAKVAPYFRHHCQEACEKTMLHRGEAYYKARVQLLELARRSFPGASITTGSKKKEDRMDLYIEKGSVKIGMKYLSYDWKLSDWEQLHHEYEEKGIPVFWILRDRGAARMTTFEYLISSKAGYSISLNVRGKSVCLKKSFHDELAKADYTYIRNYELDDIALALNGQVLCGFMEGFSAYKTQVEEKNQAILSIRKKEIGVVSRVPMEDYEDELRVSMPALEETWVLPGLVARNRNVSPVQLQDAYEKRYLYLLDVNDKILAVRSQKEKENIITNAKNLIESDTRVSAWNSFKRSKI